MRVPIADRLVLLFLVPVVVLASGGPTLAVNDAPAAQETPAAVGSLRPRPSPRPVEHDASEAVDNDADVRGSAALAAPDAAVPVRSDDPVLRWLPEITAAHDATGTPVSLIAGVMRVESGGDPETVSPQGAQGLMQVMPAELATQGVPEAQWRDPATNVLAGATILAQRAGGGWEAAVAYYFGIGCDAYGTCTRQYAIVVLGWANAYAALLGDPIAFDLGNVPDVPSAPTAPAAQSEARPARATATIQSGQPESGGTDSWNDGDLVDAPAPESTVPPTDEAPPPQSTATSEGWDEG